MPTLHWIGKEKVVNHHLDVPYRPLLRQYGFTSSASSGNTVGNRIVHGDNLEALKSLLPEFEGRVNCIYIDPPYNTGSDSWQYSDNVNDPKIQRWLGATVGRDDLCRHDKWLCMMYPRLRLLHRLLDKTGSIFISIDDNEVYSLKLICDEIYGVGNFVAHIAWEKAYTANQTAKHISATRDHTLVYAKDYNNFSMGRLARTDAQKAKFRNPDNDHRGPWKAENLSAGKFYADGQFPIVGPKGTTFRPPNGRYWRCNQVQFDHWRAEGRIHFGANGKGRPMLKKYLAEIKDELTPTTWWRHEDFGTNKAASLELKALWNGAMVFETPKPTRLLEHILTLAAGQNAIVIDSFAGSGTTAHAVLRLNAKDGGNRRFILVEMMDYAETLTAERVRRVMDGHSSGTTVVPGLGGSFDFYTVSNSPMFDEGGNIDPATDIAEVRRYIAYTEGLPPEVLVMADNPVATSFLGQHEGRGVVFHYAPETATTLDYDLLAALAFDPAHRPRSLTVYADYCILSDTALRDACVSFKKIPRDLTRL
jgi:adenine-specific DNA-methyltransferase